MAKPEQEHLSQYNAEVRLSCVGQELQMSIIKLGNIGNI